MWRVASGAQATARTADTVAAAHKRHKSAGVLEAHAASFLIIAIIIIHLSVPLATALPRRRRQADATASIRLLRCCC
jgi:hypothetical protein